MNTKKHTRWISLLLCVVMVFGMVPVTALAATSGENSSVTFTSDTFSPFVLACSNTVDYYGRDALSALTNSTALLYAYDQIVAGVEASAETITVYNGTDAITQAELEMVMDAYRRDYAHHFWLGNGYRIAGNSTSMVSVMPTYTMTGTDLETAKTTFEQKVTGILSGITSSMSEYEKELYLHDKLAETITYVEGTNAHNAYGALVEGKAVCEGYAEALQYLLQRVGIQSFLALGTSINPATGSAENHEWNYVKIDGKYYHVDLTWDDQGENLFHAYFNQTDAVIQEDHAISTAGYTLPVCNSVAAQYFTGKDTYLDSYNVETVGQLLKDNALKVHVYIPGTVNDFLSWYQTNIGNIGAAAGITGGFSYGYAQLGRELYLYLSAGCASGDHVDTDNNGRCDSCNCLMQPARLRMASISLKGNIAINYYMLLSDEVLADETAYMQFTMADGTVITTPVSEGVDIVYEGETYYVFSCEVNAKEMTDDVVCQFFYEGGSTDPFTYTAKAYADAVLETSDNENLKALLNAMKNYSAAAQIHFDHNTDDLANGTADPDYSGVTISGFEAVANQGTSLAKFYSASLILKSETTLRFFFQVDAGAESFTISYNGQPLEIKQRSGLYYADVVGISAKDLDENVTVTINDGTNTADVVYNPMAYCQGVLNDTTGTFDQNMKDLVVALYLYNQAANAYFEEN